MSGDNKRNKRVKKSSIAVLAVGLVFLVAGLTMLIIKMTAQPAVADAEFLVSSGKFVRNDAPSVVWDFTEVGKGKLTTDGGKTNYDFIWAIDNNKLKIETRWLYELSNEFEYNIDQSAKTLTLKNGDKEIVFELDKE